MAKKDKVELEVVKNEKEKEIKRKPTEEERLQFKADFDAAMKEFAETRWQISDPGNFAANDVYFFLLDYMNKYASWEKTQWMGMLKMNEELKKFMAEVNDTTGLSMDYQALEFCGFMLYNPKGIGLEAAIEFEKIADKYSKIMIVVGQKIEDARNKLKAIQYLQDKWAAAEQGFYLAELEPKPEEKPVESKVVTMEVKKDITPD
jgi:hypothetical protein